MSPGSDAHHPRSGKHSGVEAPVHPSPSHSAPIAFFLRSEQDMQQSDGHARHNSTSLNEQQPAAKSLSMEDNSFGVQSLEDALEAAFPEQITPTQPGAEPRRHQDHDNESSRSPDSSGSPILGRKRKAGNRVHPMIAATAQRIISSEHASSRSSSISSPSHRHPSRSPLRGHLRSESATSLSHSFTPLRLSPGPDSNLASTPCSDSVRSLRLSDEEGSVLDDNSSQAVHSSSEGEEEEDGDEGGKLLEADDARAGANPSNNVPQLVMPSIAMPTRRPFTERGKRMGKLKVLVAGPAGVGKTSLIKGIIQGCEDVVHVDTLINNVPYMQQHVSSPRSSRAQNAPYARTTHITEVNAATKSYPSWWSEVEEGRGLRRRKSMGDSVLERNLCFVDTPGWEISGTSEEDNMQDAVETIITYMEHSFRRNVNAGELDDSDLLSVLNGGGGFQVDVVLYMFNPNCHHISPAKADVLRRLASITNLIPVIGRVDTCSNEHIRDAKSSVRTGLEASQVATFSFQKQEAQSVDLMPPFAVSSALGDDSDVMDASVLMSSEYIQPLLSSELGELVLRLLDPENMQWLRHCAVKKFIRWRREHLGSSLLLHKQELHRLQISRMNASERQGSDGSFASSIVSSPSGVLIPHPSIGSDRLDTLTPFSASGGMSCHIDIHDFGRYSGREESTNDVKQGRLAGWALDLQNALNNERHERQSLPSLSGISRAGVDPGSKQQLTLAKGDNNYWSDVIGNVAIPSTGIDAKDPLGVLAFGQKFGRTGRTALRVLGGCGVATLAVWILRNWGIVTGLFGFTEPDVHIPGYAYVEHAGRGSADMIGGWDWKGLWWGDK